MMDELKRRVIEAGRAAGAGAVGVASRERLADGPPSGDPTYVLPGAAAVVSFWAPLAAEKIRPFLAKEDCTGYARHLGETYRRCWQIGEAISEVLRQAGHEAVNVWPNVKYRPSANPFELAPDFSHRYGAVGSGIGVFGRSGNVLVPGHGARTLLSSVITSAPLSSDPMMDETLCDDCKLCTAVCQVGMMSPTETTTVHLGGRDHVIGRKGSNGRCGICCGSWLGQHRHKEWSTWSPERLEIPETDAELEIFFAAKVAEWYQSGDPRSRYMLQRLEDREIGLHAKPLEQFDDTCGFCQLVCSATREQRTNNYKTITHSGVIVRGNDGKLRVVKRPAPEEVAAVAGR